jgi:UDP-N-acetylmuramate--alanine ligase
VITNVYPADERPIPGVSGEMIADAIRVHRDNVSYVPDRGDVAAFVAGSVRDGDLVLTFGAGDISGLGPELIELLERR